MAGPRGRVVSYQAAWLLDKGSARVVWTSGKEETGQQLGVVATTWRAVMRFQTTARGGFFGNAMRPKKAFRD